MRKDLIHKCEVLLIRPPLYHESFTMDNAIRLDIPLGVLYLASSLKKNNVEVCVYYSYTDLDIEDLERIYKSSKGPYLIGSSYQTILEKVEVANPKIVGISCMFNKNVKQVVEISKLIKNHFPDKIIIVGGAATTSFTEEFLIQGESSIDILCKGEGESTIVKTVGYVEGNLDVSQIPGILYRDSNNRYIESQGIKKIEDLDTIPFPAYEEVDMEHYFALRRCGFISRNTYNYPNIYKGIVFITSRGCPYKCVFCGNHLHMGRGIRFHSIEYVIEHIKYLNREYGVTHLHIEDDNLNCNVKHFVNMLDAIMKLPFKITWDASNGMRGDLLANEDLLKKIKRSGCNYVKIAVESGDQEIVNKVVKKNIDLNKIIKTAQLCKKLHIDIHSFYIIGFVGENINQIQKTIDFAKFLQKKYNVFPHMQVAEPIKGTELYYLAKEKNFLIHNPSGVYPYSISTPEFNEELLRKRYVEPLIRDSKLLLLRSIIVNFNLKALISSLTFFFKIHKNLPFLSIREKLFKTMLSRTMYVYSNSGYIGVKERV